MKKIIFGILLIFSVFSLSSFGLVSNSRAMLKTEISGKSNLTIQTKSSKNYVNTKEMFETKNVVNPTVKPNFFDELFSIIIISILHFCYSLFN